MYKSNSLLILTSSEVEVLKAILDYCYTKEYIFINAMDQADTTVDDDHIALTSILNKVYEVGGQPQKTKTQK